MVCAYDGTKACVEHRLDSVTISIQPGVAVSVVLASAGYPGTYPKGKDIAIGETPSSTHTRVFDLCTPLRTSRRRRFPRWDIPIQRYREDGRRSRHRRDSICAHVG